MSTQRKVRTDAYGPTGPSTQSEVEKSSQSLSHEALIRKLDTASRKTKVYSVVNSGGIWYKIRSIATTKSPIRQIRFCPNEPSIYVDEQSQYAILESVVFREGTLMATAEQPNLQDFMDAHPDNVANGGNSFYVIDMEHDAEDELDNEFLIHDAVSMVRDTELDGLLPVAMFLNIDPKKPSVEIRRELLSHAKSNPRAFIEMFDNPIVKVKAIIIQAVDFQILKINSESMRWHDNNQVIITTPAGQDSLDVMARFCLTDKGALVYAEITNRLSKL